MPPSPRRSISVDMFQKAMDLDLRWHLMRKTGEVTRVMDRGTSAIQQVLSTGDHLPTMAARSQAYCFVMIRLISTLLTFVICWTFWTFCGMPGRARCWHACLQVLRCESARHRCCSCASKIAWLDTQHAETRM